MIDRETDTETETDRDRIRQTCKQIHKSSFAEVQEKANLSHT